MFTYTLINTTSRKTITGKPTIVFNQDPNQFTLGQHVEKDEKEKKLIFGRQFLCVVPLHKYEHLFQIMGLHCQTS